MLETARKAARLRRRAITAALVADRLRERAAMISLSRKQGGALASGAEEPGGYPGSLVFQVRASGIRRAGLGHFGIVAHRDCHRRRWVNARRVALAQTVAVFEMR
jgi:hypothetical protein